MRDTAEIFHKFLELSFFVMWLSIVLDSFVVCAIKLRWKKMENRSE